MNRARIVVLTVAIGAVGIAAYLASGSDNSAPPPAPVAQLPTVDVLVAKADIGLGQTLKPDDVQWQTWPTATASAIFIRRSERPDALTEVVQRQQETGGLHRPDGGDRFLDGFAGDEPAREAARPPHTVE